MKMTKHIPLGLKSEQAVAQVSAEDYDRLTDSQVRWTFDKSIGYVSRRVLTPEGKYQKEYIHRKILGLQPGDGFVVDHINGDKLDNRRENLRVLLPGENAQNQTRSRGKSKHRGVSFSENSGKWIARVRTKTTDWSKSFENEAKAAEAAAAARFFFMPFSSN